MAMRFKNPANGYVEESSLAPLWCLLFGGFYFAVKGVWAHAFAGLLLAFPTGGLSWLIYPFCANQIMRTHYQRRGWIDVSAVAPTSIASPASPPPLPSHRGGFMNKEVPAKIWVPIMAVCAGLLAAAISEVTIPPQTTQEVAAQQAAREKAQAQEARREVLRARSHLTTAECAELYGSESSLCKPIMSAEAWRQFQAEAAQSHEDAVAARNYSDALHDYVETYHHLPPEHVVIDPN